jgi:GGDEF domain-containing protein
LWGYVISLKRLLALDDKSASPQARATWLILEAVACHAIEADAAELLAFQTSIRELVTKMDHAPNSDGTLVLAGEAIKSIETYNRGVQRSLGSRTKELQSIVSLFMRSMLQVSKSSAASASKLRLIERQIEKSCQAEDLRTIKSQLEQSLGTICQEAAEQERRDEQITEELREAMSRPDTAAVLSEAVADLDMVTGLPGFRAGEKAMRAAISAKTGAYVVLFCVDRLELINGRFGFAVGDRIMMLFGQHLSQHSSKTDQLFRWRGPAFLAVLNRSGPEVSVRAEIARILSVRIEEQIEIGARSVLLPISASSMVVNVSDSTMEGISQKIEKFALAQSVSSPK